MSRLKRRMRQAAARGVYVFRWADDGKWDVYVEAETLLGPRGVTHTKRASINFAYRIAVSRRAGQLEVR
ncbi:MAG: hypothetical protein YHS30scaffold667_50 [Phage 65_10]|nr:MAG: hypothetical protein YHS30scaffold667_50 [Phage 65_10]